MRLNLINNHHLVLNYNQNILGFRSHCLMLIIAISLQIFPVRIIEIILLILYFGRMEKEF